MPALGGTRDIELLGPCDEQAHAGQDETLEVRSTVNDGIIIHRQLINASARITAPGWVRDEGIDSIGAGEGNRTLVVSLGSYLENTVSMAGATQKLLHKYGDYLRSSYPKSS